MTNDSRTLLPKIAQTAVSLLVSVETYRSAGKQADAEHVQTQLDNLISIVKRNYGVDVLELARASYH